MCMTTQNKNQKCELCNFEGSIKLDTTDSKFVLCHNHLILFVMRGIKPKEARKLIKTHGRVFHLQEDYYDDQGHSLQPIC